MFFFQNVDFQPQIFQTLDVIGKNLRRKIIGRLVAQIARITYGIGNCAEIAVFFAVKFAVGGLKLNLLQFRIVGAFLGGEVFVKTIAAELYAESNVTGNVLRGYFAF